MIFGNGATGGVIGVGMVVSLYDNVSKNADTVMNKFKDLEGVTDAAAAKMVGAMDRIQIGFGLLAVGGAMIASIAFPIKSAIEFESAFTGVRKTVTATEQEFKQIENNFRTISKNAPITAVALSEIGEMAGQLGVKGVDNITKFTDTIAKLSVTTNLTAEAGSTQFARIANIMQEPIQNVDRMGSTVVSLGNNFATTESEITAFINRIAGAGQVAGLSTSDLMGIAAAFSSVGITAERGGTAVSKTLFKMTTAAKMGGETLNQFAEITGMSANGFAEFFEKDAAGAFNKFVEGLGTAGIEAVGLLDELELSDSSLKQLFISVAGAGGIMENAISSASKAWSENTALTKEAELRYNTVASQLQIMKNNFVDLFITIGQFFLPVMKVLSSTLRIFATGLNIIASTGIGKVLLSVAGTVAVLTTGIGLYLVASGAATFASAKLAIMFAGMGKAAIATAFANGGLTAGFYALATSIWTAMGPFLPFIAAGLAIVGVVVLLKKSMTSFSELVSGNTEPLKGFAGLMQKVGGIMTGIVEIFKSANGETFSLTESTFKALNDLGIAETVISIGTYIARIKAFFSGIGSTFSYAWGIVSDVTNSIINALDSMFNYFGFDMSKATSNIDTWAIAGKILGGVILAYIIPPLIGMALGVLAATWPILLLVGAIVAIIAVFTNWGSIIDWIGDKFGSVIAGIIQFGAELLWFFATLPYQMLRIGFGIVDAIITGIQEGWGGLVSKLLQLFASLPGGQVILDFFGVSTGAGAKNAGGVTSKPETTPNGPTPLGRTIGETKSYSKSSETITNTNSESKEVLKNVNLFIDGKQVAASVNKRGVLEDSRN